MSEAGQGALMRRVVGNTAYLQGAVLISGLGVAGAQFMAARMLTTPDGDTVFRVAQTRAGSWLVRRLRGESHA